MMAGAGAIDGPGWAGPLQGVKVVDFTRILAGPFATHILGDLGASIIKIEHPEGGDETRNFPPFVGEESHYFVSVNRNKRSIVLDLGTPEGVEVARDLCRDADILVENFRPGVMDRLGLGYAALAGINPRLIYCAISGFGLDGPLRDKASFDIVVQAMTGIMSVNGERGGPPVKLGIPLGDMIGGIFGSIASLAAIHERTTTGRGRLIDVSLYDGLLGMLGYYAQLAFLTGEDPQRTGSSHTNIVPYGAFPARDGEIIIACLTDRFWRKMCHALGLDGLADDDRFSTAELRKQNRVELDAIIAGATAQKTVGELQEILDRIDVPNAPILGVTAALNHEHAKARRMVVEAQHPTAGPIRMVGRPIKFPGSEQTDLAAPPTLGQHSQEILRELGYDADRIARLIGSGALGTGKDRGP